MIRLIIIFLMVFGIAKADRDGGPYIGVGYGMSEFGKNDIYKDLKENRANSYNVYAGAAINKYLSVEISNIRLGGYILANDSELKTIINSLSTLVQYPFLDDMFAVYAKVGVGHIKLSTIKDTGFTYVFGGGVSYRYNKYLALKVGYEYYPFDYESDKIESSMKIEYAFGAIEVQF